MAQHESAPRRLRVIGERVMIGATLVFLVAYAYPIVHPETSADVRDACDAVMTAMWALFVAEYLVRLVRAEDKPRFLRRNLLDLALVVLPMFRPLRLLRLLAALSILDRMTARSLRGKLSSYAAGGALLLLVIAALAVTEAERGRPGATIDSVTDGLWWAITTMTTVGYGDKVPVTVTGRIIAATLMIGGIAILGVITGTVASLIVERIDESVDSQEEILTAMRSLESEVRQLRAELEASRPAVGPAEPPPEE